MIRPATGTRRVLVIDDIPVTDAIKLGIERRGMQIMAFNDPVEAVRNFKAGDYDFVLLDFQMPRLNGFEVYRELRKTDKEVKICFLTGFTVSEREFAKVFPDAKIAAFLTKPVELSVLIKLVNDSPREERLYNGQNP